MKVVARNPTPTMRGYVHRNNTPGGDARQWHFELRVAGSTTAPITRDSTPYDTNTAAMQAAVETVQTLKEAA